MTPSLYAQLSDFIDEIPKVALASSIAERTEEQPNDVLAWLEIYLNETRAALQFIAPQLETEQGAFKGRILEVGSGLCILSHFLKASGFDITAEEPALGGFGRFEAAMEVIKSHFAHLNLTVITVPAHELCNEVDGKFDLIFSYNVLEHIPNLFITLSSLVSNLNSGGLMVHNCPNYIFPYEPHLHIPVIKPIKRLSEWLFAKKIAQKKELWDSLNFITYFEVRNFCRQNNLNIEFQKGLLQKAFTRLDNDPIYKQRHSTGLIFNIYAFLKTTRLIYLLAALPTATVSPMQFHISHKKTVN